MKPVLLFCLLLPACASTTEFHTFRLKPGQDLSQSIQHFAKEKKIEAGSIVTVVGSLNDAAIRYANRDETTHVKKDLEIVSLTGTVSTHGSHLHLSVSDAQGTTLGGHLMDGSIVRTTAEITIVQFLDQKFLRVQDAQTGYEELQVKE